MNRIKPMKVLFYGAGVIGSLYADRLHECGHDITVLARGKRLKDLRAYGIVLQKINSGFQSVSLVKVIEVLDPEDCYDLIVVPVRREQLAAIIPILAVNGSPNILVMVNNPLGYEELKEALGGRVCIGFPGAGGELDGYIVRYTLAPGIFQPVTFGEINGEITPRIKTIGTMFHQAGFPVALSRNIDAWQKAHVAWVSPVANAIYAADGDIYQLARRSDMIHSLLCAIRKNFAVLQKLEIPITPVRLKVWLLPGFILTPFLKILFNTRFAENIMAKHANKARLEMEQLAGDFAQLANMAIDES